MNWIRKIFKFSLYVLYLFVVTFVVLEVIFRILPTSNPIIPENVTDENDILRFKSSRVSTTSLGVNFYQKAEKRTNNYGFVSSIDYESGANPDIAVIGDSYVAAMEIDNEESIGELITQIDSDLTVYQLGVSGVPLSQYMKMIDFALSEFNPKEFLVVVVGNDFDESLCSYRIKEGTWCFDDNMDLKFYPFHGYSALRSTARQSAFIRYVVFNAGVNWRRVVSAIGLTDKGLSAAHEYAGNTERVKPEIIAAQSRLVIDKFFELVANRDLSNRLTIILDADRNDIYSGLHSASYFSDMRNYLIGVASKFGVAVIDMEPIFRSDFSQHKLRFNFPTDAHWNEHTHRLAAEAFLNNR